MQLGLRVPDLELLDYADVLDMVEESVKDWEEPDADTDGVKEATQDDFDNF